MTSIDDSKRLNDEELEAVAGGMTPIDPMLLNAMGHGFPGLNLNPTVADTHAAAAPPTIDPSAVAGLMHSTVSSAVAGGGAYSMATPAPTATHIDAGAPTITGNTHVTVSGDSVLGGSAPIVAPPTQPPVEVHSTITLTGPSIASSIASMEASSPQQPDIVMTPLVINPQGAWGESHSHGQT